MPVLILRSGATAGTGLSGHRDVSPPRRDGNYSQGLGRIQRRGISMQGKCKGKQVGEIDGKCAQKPLSHSCRSGNVSMREVSCLCC